MSIKDGHSLAALARRVGVDAAHRSTRRTFLLTAAAWPALGWMGLARAQPAKPAGKVMRVDILRTGTAAGEAVGPLAKVFIATMRELGWVEGRNVVYDIAYADGDATRFPELAAGLVARRPDVIYASNGPMAQAVFDATRTIPIVFSSVADPVGYGFVKSLAQPGGNATGIATFDAELGGRRMQLLKEVLPKMSRVGVLVTGTRVSLQEQKVIEAAAGAGVKVSSAVAKTPDDLQGALAALMQSKPEAVLLTQTALFMAERKRILELAGKYRVPVAGYRAEQVEDGALMSYNSNLADHTRRAAHLVDKVLRGAKPADIPVELPTKFALVVNLKTAKALGISIPQSVLLQADRVIE